MSHRAAIAAVFQQRWTSLVYSLFVLFFNMSAKMNKEFVIVMAAEGNEIFNLSLTGKNYLFSFSSCCS
jgi:hypothetical protein